MFLKLNNKVIFFTHQIIDTLVLGAHDWVNLSE